ncbi:MAG: hypothetical protein ACR2PZ_26695 [Pseudomonadales bacterium]
MRNLIYLIVLVPAIAGAAEPTSANLLSEPFFESYQPEVNVSGHVIVGVMSASAAKSLAIDRIGVRTTQLSESLDMCLRATSSDGIYSSRNHYQVPAPTSGSVHLPYRSEMTKIINEYQPGDLAISANVGDCDNTSSDYYVVMSVDAIAPAAIHIYLNSFGATDVFYEIDGNEQPPKPCDYVSEGRRTTFDFYCTLTAVEDAGLKVNIIRERFGREQPGVEMNILGIAR